MYYYNIYGWLTQEEIPGRSTTIQPPEETETLKANFTGTEWVLVEYFESAPIERAAPPNPTEWLIDIGPFFDRFGAAKMAVLTSADAGVKAILADTQVRKWIDLKRPDVVQSILYLSSVIPSITEELRDNILNTPVSEEENSALRKLYFS